MQMKISVKNKMLVVNRLGEQHIWCWNSSCLNSSHIHPVSLGYLMEISNFLFHQTCFFYFLTSLSIWEFHLSSCLCHNFGVILNIFFLLHPTFKISGNSVGSTFKMSLVSDDLSLLLPLLSESLSSTWWLQ